MLLEPFAAEGALTREGTKGTDVSLTTSPLHFLASEPLLLVLSSEALRSDQVTSRTKTVAPYMVRNETGVPIIITLARADGGAGVTQLLGEGDAVLATAGCRWRDATEMGLRRWERDGIGRGRRRQLRQT